jgi:hypothetical protein
MVHSVEWTQSIDPRTIDIVVVNYKQSELTTILKENKIDITLNNVVYVIIANYNK